MKKKSYPLQEAVKEFYASERMETDLANRVADRLYLRRRKSIYAEHLWTLPAIVVLCCGMAYGLALLLQASIVMIFFAIVLLIGMGVIARKEFQLFSQKVWHTTRPRST